MRRAAGIVAVAGERASAAATTAAVVNCEIAM